MKKIALASAAMGGAALLAFGASGTFAALSDTTTQDVGTVAAGSVVVNTWDKTSANMASTPLTPGDSVVRSYYVQNGGSVAGRPSAQVLNVTNVDDGCTSSSERSIDDCTNPSAGDLAAQVVVSYATFAPTGTDCVVPSNQRYVTLGGLTEIGGKQASDGSTLAAQQALCVAFQLTFVEGESDNKAQGDSFTAQVQFGLEQVV
ncbi:TasA family protein [Geodermatophilus sp. SYSU D00700]